jgi:hypothetical protein
MEVTRHVMTPVGAVLGGLAAGTVGTLAMDLFLYARYRDGGGKSAFPDWEFSADVHSWEEAPAPAHVGKRLFEGLFQRRLPDSRAALVNNVTHWAMGILSGAQFGLVAGSLSAARVRYGVPFGAAVWAGGYVVLPAARLYKPMWEYDAPTLAQDLGAHLVYGLTTAAVFNRVFACARRSQLRTTRG